MSLPNFTPHHISVRAEDLQGNDGAGRFLILPGSDGRALAISKKLENGFTRPHPRAHNFYGGTYHFENTSLDVGMISTGMGGPSTDIIVTELLELGAKFLIRVGTCGSLQHETVKGGDVVCVTSCVRDEYTTRNYVPVEYPATASLDFLLLSKSFHVTFPIHWGIAHSKDSLYAREFGYGPQSGLNKDYIEILKKSGVLASEMEASTLYVLSSLKSAELRKNHKPEVLFGCYLAVIGDSNQFANGSNQDTAIENALECAFRTMIQFKKQAALK